MIENNKIAVLIPCFNESLTVSKVINDFLSVLPEAEIYVYDNNSTDNTAEIARAAGAIVRHESKQGKANVVRSMFRDIDADCYILVDGDDTYPAENCKEMANLIISGKANMVIGDRLSTTYFTENKRRFHGFGNSLVKNLVNSFFKGKIHDIMSGYRAFGYDFVKSYPIICEGFEIETDMTIFALDHKFSIASVPITYRDRQDGSFSKLNTFKDGIRVLKIIFTLFKDYKPLTFFSSLSVMLLLIGGLLFYSVFKEFMMSLLVPRIPTLILSLFIMLAALVSFYSGLILDVEYKNTRRIFELHLHRLKLKK